MAGLLVMAGGASEPARAACGGLNQQSCRANQNATACQGALVNSGGRCRIRPTRVRPKGPDLQLQPREQLKSGPRARPSLCNPSQLLQKGGKC